jgi:hypothetical protein
MFMREEHHTLRQMSTDKGYIHTILENCLSCMVGTPRRGRATVFWGTPSKCKMSKGLSVYTAQPFYTKEKFSKNNNLHDFWNKGNRTEQRKALQD